MRKEEDNNKKKKEKEREEEEVKVDVIKALYYKKRDSFEDDSESLQWDITDEFYYALSDKVENHELINIAIKGEVSGSKSTSAIALLNHISNILERRCKKKINRFKHIFADQTEFLRFINTEETDVAIVIDEFSRMAETGLNATTEIALFNYYSDVFAQKFVHRISCSPATILDLNANIILEYVGKNVEKRLSKFILRYRNTAEGFREYTLGCVYINVSEIIDEEYYVKYRKKKFDRMALLDKHGVRDIRELEFSDIIIDVVDDLREYVTDGDKSTLSDLVLASISRICREKKRIYSIITTNEIASRCKNLLCLHTDYYKAKIKMEKGKSETEREMYKKKIKKILEVLGKEIDENIRKRDIYEEYLKVGKYEK